LLFQIKKGVFHSELMEKIPVGYEINHFLYIVKLRICAGRVVEGLWQNHCDAGGKLRANIDPSWQIASLWYIVASYHP